MGSTLLLLALASKLEAIGTGGGGRLAGGGALQLGPGLKFHENRVAMNRRRNAQSHEPLQSLRFRIRRNPDRHSPVYIVVHNELLVLLVSRA